MNSVQDKIERRSEKSRALADRLVGAAEAVIAARTKIVQGAVGMVELALNGLAERGIMQLDNKHRAAMVSNLLVVRCSDHDATPVVNAGTLYN